SRVAMSAAPAGGGGLRRRLAGHAGQRLRGDQVGAGVDEVLAARVLRLGAALGHLGHGLHAELGHLARVLGRVGRYGAVLQQTVDVLAAAVDRDHQDVGLVGGLERLDRAVRAGLVDGVHDVDVRVLGQAVLHGGLAAGDRAGGGLVAGHRVVAALAAGVAT